MDEKRLLKFGLMIAKGVRTHEGWESVVVGKCGRVSVLWIIWRSASDKYVRFLDMLRTGNESCLTLLKSCLIFAHCFYFVKSKLIHWAQNHRRE